MAQSFDAYVAALRAAAEPSRLRLLAICAKGEWTVSDLTRIVGQSQPRVSRHLKVLQEAGLLERFKEGAWVLYRRASEEPGAGLARALLRRAPAGDAAFQHDGKRVDQLREDRRAEAAKHFDAMAARLAAEPALAQIDAAVDQALEELFAREPAKRLLDVGVGGGHVLALLASKIEEGLGVDISTNMLAAARARLDGADARNCRVRYGEMTNLPALARSYDAIVMHQVLHFADDPAAAIAEAARVARPGGRLVVVDLARHDDEAVRSAQGHRRLGFAEAEMRAWFQEAGLVARDSAVFEAAGRRTVLWLAQKPPFAAATLGASLIAPAPRESA